MIDIIIPVYNAQNYLFCALSSINNQTIKNKVSVIIVDDHSTQDYSDIINHYKDINIKYIYLKKNRGPGVARNVGIKHSSNPYIVFLDADDIFYDNNVLEEMINLIENSSCLIGKELLYNKTGIQFGNLHGKLYLRKIIEQNKIKFPSLYYGEDTIFNILYILKIPENKIKITNEIFYKWQKVNKNSLSYQKIKISNFWTLFKLSEKSFNKTCNELFKQIYLGYLLNSVYQVLEKDYNKKYLHKIKQFCDNYVDDIKEIQKVYKLKICELFEEKYE